MLHLAFRKRLHQIRGVNHVARCDCAIGGSEEYEEGERVAARIAAAMTCTLKKAMRHCMTTVTAMANACLILPPVR